MTFYTIATGRWSWFWGGFVMFSTLDGIAGFYHLTHETMNAWLIELCFLPFAVISVLLLRYRWQHWPSWDNTTLEAGRKTNV